MNTELETRILIAFANELELDGQGFTFEKLQAMTDLANALATITKTKAAN
jgi:hypothetical protein